MTTGLTYADYVNQISTLAVVSSTDAAFVTILPQMLTYAENRIYRDLDFLSTTQVLTGYKFTIGSRVLAISAADFVTLQQINVITPATIDVANSGTRVTLLPTTKEFIDNVYPSAASAGTPAYFAMFDQSTILVGPWPDSTYSVEVVGTYRPESLSTSTPTTFLSLYLPDLLIMASMIYISGYQRNFGRANDDPQMAVSYESQYKTLMQGAMIEEARKKFQSSGWTSMSPSPIATPTRG
jgi:hypothetical protein